MQHHLIIVAAGKGSRMGSEIPKQFMQLAGKPVLLHTIEKFQQAIPELNIVVVIAKEYTRYWDELCSSIQMSNPIETVIGGSARFHSVDNGLRAIAARQGIVAVHDAVRPLVSGVVIKNGFEAAKWKRSAVPVITVNESIRLVENENSSVADRDKYRIVQTPQFFEINLLRKAYSQPYRHTFTDDASVVEALGEKINLIDGNRENIKLTYPSDMLMAETILRLQANSQ